MKTIAAALAVVLSLSIRERASFGGVAVRRVSLLGYQVAGQVLEAAEAADALASLVARTRAALAIAAEECKALGVHGRYTVEVEPKRRGNPVVRVEVRMADAHWTRDRQASAVREGLIACRAAGLFVDLGARGSFTVRG